LLRSWNQFNHISKKKFMNLKVLSEVQFCHMPTAKTVCNLFPVDNTCFYEFFLELST